jgi:hypothetical protein
MLVFSFKWWQMMLCAGLRLRFFMHVHTLYMAKILWVKNCVYVKLKIWAVLECHCSRISYYRSRIICIQLSNNPYPSDITNTISQSASAHNSIQIIHICLDIKNSSLYSHDLDSDRMRKLSTPISSLLKVLHLHIRVLVFLLILNLSFLFNVVFWINRASSGQCFVIWLYYSKKQFVHDLLG